jgi:hypothetical protein
MPCEPGSVSGRLSDTRVSARPPTDSSTKSSCIRWGSSSYGCGCRARLMPLSSSASLGSCSSLGVSFAVAASRTKGHPARTQRKFEEFVCWSRGLRVRNRRPLRGCVVQACDPRSVSERMKLQTSVANQGCAPAHSCQTEPHRTLPNRRSISLTESCPRSRWLRAAKLGESAIQHRLHSLLSQPPSQTHCEAHDVSIDPQRVYRWKGGNGIHVGRLEKQRL